MAGISSAPALHPLRFGETIQTYAFGGTQIPRKYPAKRLRALPRIAETWEVWGESAVREGPFAGKRLNELCHIYGAKLLGEDVVGRTGTDFPLLLKFLDATADLELGVHPDEAAVGRGLIRRGRSKYEAWYVVSCSPGCRFLCGTRDGVTAPDFTEAAVEGRARRLMNEFVVAAGDAIYVPGGRLHSIGATSLVAEIQDNNGDVYLFEWPYQSRTPRETRELIEANLRFGNLDDHGNGRTVPITIQEEEGVSRTFLVACGRFSLERYDVAKAFELHLKGRKFAILTCLSGGIRLQQENGAATDLAPGQTALVPASMEAVTLAPQTRASFLRAYVPNLEEDVIAPLRARGFDDGAIVALGGDMPGGDLAQQLGAMRSAN